MTINQPFNEPFFFGAGSSDRVPFYSPVAIDGQEYIIDLRHYERRYLPAQRQAIDDSNEPGDQTLNPLGLWPRSGDNYRAGAGQLYRDTPRSNPGRFYESIGVDVWDENSSCLLPDVEVKRSSANTNLNLLAINSRVVLTDGQQVLYTDDPTGTSPTWTAYTGTPASNVESISTDGFYLFVSYGANGIYRGDVSGASLSSFSATASNFVVYANGRLLSGNDEVLNEIDGSGVATAIYTHDSTSFRWNHGASSPAALYVGGYQGDRSETYYIGVDSTDGSLTEPVFATSLPDGEYATSLKFYAGSFVLGTSLGVRLAQATDQNRSLIYGPLIETGGSVTGLAGRGEFVWFSWGNYSSSYTGVGRMKLSEFTGPLSPAYATDLMYLGQGDVISMAVFDGQPYFAVSGTGIIGPQYSAGDLVLVESGTIDIGVVNYGTSLPKSHVALRLTFDPMVGSIDCFLTDAAGVQYTIASEDTPGTTERSSSGLLKNIESSQARLKFTLNRGTTTTGPCLRRWTLLALPKPDRTEIISVPIIFKNRTQYRGIFRYMDLIEVYDELRSLVKSRRVIQYQEGEMIHLAYIDDLTLRPQEWGDNFSYMEGIMMASLITVDY